MTRLFEIEDGPEGNLLQRAVWWAMFMSEILITQPQLREQVPDGAELYALPVNDPELFVHNLELAQKSTNESQVFINVRQNETQVDLFAPMQKMPSFNAA